MSFMRGFQKIADNAATGGHNNQGLQFNSAEDEKTSTAGPGGMNPSGIATYQPSGPNNPTKAQTKKAKDRIAQMICGSLFKLSSTDGVPDALPGYTAAGGAGNASGGGSANQQKWETSSDDVPERMGYNPESKAVYDRYRRAVKRGKKK